MKKIFISYRRAGGEALAYLLYEKLVQKGYTVFYDIESLGSGNFDSKIVKTIAECDVFLLILPPNALDNCCYKEDWVRREIKCALDYNRKIVQVMMRDFAFPENLPIEIQKIKNIQGVSFESMDFIDARIQKLIDYIEENASGVGIDSSLRKKKNEIVWAKIKWICAIIATVVGIVALMIGLREMMANNDIDSDDTIEDMLSVDTSEDTQSVDTIPVTGIYLKQTNIYLNPGAYVSLMAQTVPENATNQNITWKSSDINIASVSDGIVSAKKNGTVTITAMTEDGSFTAQCTVYVSDEVVPVTEIRLSASSMTLIADNVHSSSEWLEAYLVPDSATVHRVKWSVSDYSVIDIAFGDDEMRALIVARAAGTAVVTVTTQDGSIMAQCVVTVVG